MSLGNSEGFMIDLRNYGFEEQHQQIYDMAWRYARERITRCCGAWMTRTGFPRMNIERWATSACSAPPCPSRSADRASI